MNDIPKNTNEQKSGYKAGLVWLTGLSGAGKSTLADKLSIHLCKQGIINIRLDGDVVRKGLCSDLGFSPEDRFENIRRIAELSKILITSGLLVIGSFISPRIEDRKLLVKIIGESNYLEVFCKCSLETCESRDIKGLYARARQGELKDFTGISSPYEIPPNPHLILDTENQNIEQSFDSLLKHVNEKYKNYYS